MQADLPTCGTDACAESLEAKVGADKWCPDWTAASLRRGWGRRSPEGPPQEVDDERGLIEQSVDLVGYLDMPPVHRGVLIVRTSDVEATLAIPHDKQAVNLPA